MFISFLLLVLICSLTVSCGPREHEIRLRVRPEDGGSVTGEGIYPRDRDIAVKAEAADGYEFEEWREGNRRLSTSPNYPFVVREDRTLTAVFREVDAQ